MPASWGGEFKSLLEVKERGFGSSSCEAGKSDSSTQGQTSRDDLQEGTAGAFSLGFNQEF